MSEQQKSNTENLTYYIKKLEFEKQELLAQLKLYNSEIQALEKMVDEDNQKLNFQISEISRNFEISEKKKDNLKRQLTIYQQNLAELEIMNGKLMKEHGLMIKKIVFLENQNYQMENLLRDADIFTKTLQNNLKDAEKKNNFLESECLMCGDALEELGMQNQVLKEQKNCQ